MLLGITGLVISVVVLHRARSSSQIPGGLESSARVIRPLVKAVEPLGCRPDDEREEQFFLVERRKLFADLVAQDRFHQSSCPIAQKRVFPDRTRKQTLIEAQNEDRPESRAAGGHGV